MNVRKMKDMRDDSSMDVTCTFKRGGKCEIHGVIGTRNTSSKKVWAELKGGLFGWKYMTYSCNVRKNPVVKPVCQDSPYNEMSNTVLGEDITNGQGYLLCNTGRI